MKRAISRRAQPRRAASHHTTRTGSELPHLLPSLTLSPVSTSPRSHSPPLSPHRTRRSHHDKRAHLRLPSRTLPLPVRVADRRHGWRRPRRLRPHRVPSARSRLRVRLPCAPRLRDPVVILLFDQQQHLQILATPRDCRPLREPTGRRPPRVHSVRRPGSGRHHRRY